MFSKLRSALNAQLSSPTLGLVSLGGAVGSHAGAGFTALRTPDPKLARPTRRHPASRGDMGLRAPAEPRPAALAGSGGTAGAPVKMDFLRFEFKYLLGQDLRDRIERDIRHFMTLDPFVAGQKDCNYIVRSLYYDDPAFSSYYEKTDGMLHRAKFRLRTYTNDRAESSPTYLEIKGRHNSLVFKHRAAIRGAAGSRIFADCAKTTEEILAAVEQGEVAEQFRYELLRKQLQPIMLIDYVRRPYFSKHDAEFRLTLDSHLHGTMTDQLFPAADRSSRMLVPGLSVMEIKFKSHIPSWFHRIICNYSLERTSISKVCKGVEAWHLVPEL